MAVYSFVKSIIPDKLHAEVEALELPDFQYVETVGNTVNLYFADELSSELQTALSATVTAHQTTSMAAIIDAKIQAAVTFGEATLKEFTIENVLLGITQVGKTRQVSDACHKLAHYISTGSLYAAVEQVDDMINAGLDPNLAPFVTEARLLIYKAKIVAFLSA